MGLAGFGGNIWNGFSVAMVMLDEVYQQYRIVDHHACYFMNTVDAINRIFNALAFHILDGANDAKTQNTGD